MKLTFDIICIDVVAARDTRIVGERHSGVVEGEDVLNISQIIVSYDNSKDITSRWQTKSGKIQFSLFGKNGQKHTKWQLHLNRKQLPVFNESILGPGIFDRFKSRTIAVLSFLGSKGK